jgi:hypothetical protein
MFCSIAKSGENDVDRDIAAAPAPDFGAPLRAGGESRRETEQIFMAEGGGDGAAPPSPIGAFGEEQAGPIEQGGEGLSRDIVANESVRARPLPGSRRMHTRGERARALSNRSTV